MDTEQFADGEIPEGYEAFEVVSADEWDGDSDGEDDVVLDENGERIASEEVDPQPKKSQRQVDSSNEADRFRRERDEARAEASRYRQQVEGNQNARDWAERKQKVNSLYKEAKANIFKLSNNADDPNNFINDEIERLNAWKDQELEKEFQVRESRYMGEIVRLSLPQYAEKLGRDYGLKAADVKRLASQQDPSKMEAMAETLYDIRRSEGVVANNNKKAAKFAQNAVSTSSGGRSIAKRVKAGSDDHLALLDPTFR